MSLKKNIAISYFTQVLNTGLGFIASVFITRLLGPEGRGDFSIFTNAVGLTSVWLGFSLPSAIIYYVASNKIKADRLLSTMLVFSLATTGLMALCLPLLFQSQLQWLIFPERYQNFSWQVLFLIQFFITQFTNTTNAILNAKKIFINQALFSTAVAAVAVATWMLLYFHIVEVKVEGFGLVVFVTLLLLLPPLLYNLYLLLWKANIRPSIRLLGFPELKDMFRFTFIVYIANAFQFLSYRMDLWFVDYYHGKAETGIYSLAVTLSQLLWMLPNVIASVLFSYISSSTREEALTYLVRYVRISFYAALTLGIIAFVCFYYAVPLIYGPAFTSSRLMIGLLLLGTIPFSIPIICGNFFAGVNKVKFNLWASLSGFIVCLVFDLLLIPNLKAIGACVATILSYLTNAIYCFIVIRIYFKTSLNLSFTALLKEDVQKIWSNVGVRFFQTKQTLNP